MKSESLKILKHVAKIGEMSVEDAVTFFGNDFEDHKDLYPLSLLISEEFLGISVTMPAFDGAEKMPELEGATLLHMTRIKPDEKGEISYNGITTLGKANGKILENEKIFIRAKGSLYLDELRQKRNDRIISFLVGFLAALLPLLLSKYIPKS